MLEFLYSLIIIFCTLAAISPVIINPPISASVVLNSDFTLTCEAFAQPTPQYRWFVLRGARGVLLENEVGPFLSFQSVNVQDRGVYYCSVSNELNTVNSSEAILNIQGKYGLFFLLSKLVVMKFNVREAGRRGGGLQSKD